MTAVGHTAPDGDRLSIGIVLYYPDLAHLRLFLRSLSHSAARILLFQNSPFDTTHIHDLEDAARPAQLRFLNQNGDNLGLGEAYNALLDESEAAGCSHIVLFDQDSLPSPLMVSSLVSLFRQLSAAGHRPAVVGPTPVTSRGEKLRTAPWAAPQLASVNAREVQFAISSGSLIDISRARSIGSFRNDFFIDCIDLEWCFRARSKGFSIWLGTDIVMAHELGTGVILGPLGLRLTDQPPRRIYTFFRNQIAMLKLRHVPLSHKVRWIVGLPFRIGLYLVRYRFSPTIFRAIFTGCSDGATSRLGPPRLF